MKTERDSHWFCSYENEVPIWQVQLQGVASDVGKGDFSLVRGILHVCGHAHV